MGMFEFQIHSKDGLSRTGTLNTPHGTIKTPVFMPVGTLGSVKGLTQEELLAIDAEIILSNTYHLFLRPGEKLIKENDGLHKWINWPKPMLTDSGGYQVFSLGGKRGQSRVKIDENGVKFTSHIDGSKHYLTPEKAIQIQHDLGADIIMAFDECAPADSTKEYFKKALTRTHNWLERCVKEHKGHEEKQALFGIVQGGLFADLRKESAEFVNSLNLPGNAIGGLSVGESKEDMDAMIKATIPHLSENKPRYLMGVGTPEDLLNGVEQGIDMFDCVNPTRIARHGTFYNFDGQFSIKNEQFKNDTSPLCPELEYPGNHYSRSYIRHLFREKEMLALRLLSINNLKFLINLMQLIRANIEQGTFQEFKTTFLERFNSKK